MAQAGKYRTLMTIEKDVASAKDSYGATPENWEVVADDVWVDLAPLQGRELFAAQQIQEEISHRVRLRWRPDLDLTGRLRGRIGDRVLILHPPINAGERNVEWELLATERF